MSSDELNTLPEGWELVKFDDLFNITSSKRVHKKDWVSEGVPFYRAREIVKISNNGFVDNELFITKKMFDEFNEKYGSPEKDDILVTGVGTLGICYIVKPNDKFYFKDGNIIWFKKKVEVESRYIEYGFQSDYIRNQVYSGGGSTVATYTIIRAKNTTIPLPSLEEQKRIVAKIDTLFSKIDKAISLTEQSLKQVKNLLPSVLKEELFNKRDVSTVFTFTTLVDNFDSNRIPINSNGGDTMNCDYPYYGASGIIDYINKYIFDGEYLLISEDGANLVARKYPIAFIANGKFWVNNHAHIVQAKKKLTTNKFLEYFFANLDLSDFITGSAQPKLSQKKLNSIECFIPKLSTQTELCDLFDKYSLLSKKTQSKLEEQLAYLKQLKSSILSKAFQGEL